MTKIPDLCERRGFKVAEMRSIVEAAETAGRDLTPDETARFDTLKGESKAIEERIARAEFLAEAERRAHAEPVTSELARETRGYSVAKGVQEFSAGRLTGREAEIQTELSRGREARGLLVPVEILLGETRSQTVSSDPSGGYLVATQLPPSPIAFALRSKSNCLARPSCAASRAFSICRTSPLPARRHGFRKTKPPRDRRRVSKRSRWGRRPWQANTA